MIGLTMRSVTWNRFPIKNLWLIPCFFHLWSEVTWIQICASLNHRKKMKAEPSWLIPLKPIENVELFIVWVGFLCFSQKNTNLFLFKKPKKTDLKNKWVVFLKKNRFFSTLIIFQSFFVIFSWSHDLEQVTSLSVWLGVRGTLRVYVLGNEEAENC